jgi:hypothetical protein
VALGCESVAGELEMAALDSDMAFVAELVHDGEKIKEGSKVHIQVRRSIGTGSLVQLTRLTRIKTTVRSWHCSTRLRRVGGTSGCTTWPSRQQPR